MRTANKVRTNVVNKGIFFLSVILNLQTKDAATAIWRQTKEAEK